MMILLEHKLIPLILINKYGKFHLLRNAPSQVLKEQHVIVRLNEMADDLEELQTTLYTITKMIGHSERVRNQGKNESVHTPRRCVLLYIIYIVKKPIRSDSEVVLCTRQWLWALNEFKRTTEEAIARITLIHYTFLQYKKPLTSDSVAISVTSYLSCTRKTIPIISKARGTPYVYAYQLTTTRGHGRTVRM